MAKYYFRLLLLVTAIIAFFALIGSLLPRSYSFETSIEIAADPQVVFTEVNSLRRWPSWSRQFNPELIEGLQISYNGEEQGIGAAQSWQDVRGDGKLWIIDSEPGKLIAYQMKFDRFPAMSSEIRLAPTTTGTRVLWKSSGKLPGGPFYGYFGWLFGIQMKNEYQKSLEGLKALLEPKK